MHLSSVLKNLAKRSNREARASVEAQAEARAAAAAAAPFTAASASASSSAGPVGPDPAEEAWQAAMQVNWSIFDHLVYCEIALPLRALGLANIPASSAVACEWWDNWVKAHFIRLCRLRANGEGRQEAGAQQLVPRRNAHVGGAARATPSRQQQRPHLPKQGHDARPHPGGEADRHGAGTAGVLRKRPDRRGRGRPRPLPRRPQRARARARATARCPSPSGPRKTSTTVPTRTAPQRGR